VKRATFMMRACLYNMVLMVMAALLLSGAPADAATRSPRKAAPAAKSAPAKKAPAKRAAPAKKATSAKKAAPAKSVAPPRPDVSSICVEAGSGLVLCEENADILRPPASMIKMMLMLLVSEGLRDGKWTLETPITGTKHSQGMGGTQVYLKEGETFPLNQMMLAIAVCSANDAAMAVAEGLWGSEDAYKKRMNERAAELGMTNSRFNSVHGLPPVAGQDPDQTTARDMAKLAQVLVRDPLVFTWTNVKEFVFRPGETAKQNTNKLLWQMENCDGLKTGFINMAGFCVTATAMRQNIRLITVVMGGNQSQERFSLAKNVIDGCFTEISRVKLLNKGDMIEPGVPVANCEQPEVRLAAAEDLWVVIKQADKDKISLVADHPAQLSPPAQAGAAIGSVRAELSGTTLGSVSLVTPVELRQARWHWKLIRSIY